MRILFFSHYFPPEVNAPATRTYEHCKEWVANGHEVSVITCAPNHPNGVLYQGYQNKLFQEEIHDGIRVVRVWTFLAANEGFALRIANFISYMLSAVVASLFLGKFDLVIATSPQFFCGWAGVISAKLKRTLFVLEIRDLWPESIVAVGALSSSRLTRFLKFLANVMYRSADHIVTVGEGYRDELLKYEMSPAKVSVIHNGIDFGFFQTRKCDLSFSEEYQLGGRFVCAYVGTVGLAHGLDVVIRAATLLKESDPEVVFVIVGDGASRERLEAEVSLLALRNVIFTGRLAKDRMPEVLASCDCCLVHLKKTELFTTVLPSKMLEAMAMSRPVVLGVSGYSAKLLRDANAGIAIEPENEGELIEAMRLLAKDPRLAKTYGENGLSYVRMNFDRKVNARKFIELLYRLTDFDL